MRILVTSDLHIEAAGPEPIRRMVAGMDREHPDLVVIGGDLGSPASLFEQCLSLFIPLKCPVAVVPGNHDVWGGHGHGSRELFDRVLPEIVRGCGFHWLEAAPLVMDDGTAVCGSIGWYDYSAAEPSLELSAAEIAEAKHRYIMDAQRIDWDWSDVEFAERCRLHVHHQMLTLEEDTGVDNVVVVTHVPVFESQIERDPADPEWSRGNAYFGHLTLGEALRGFRKVRYVVSGHTHIGQYGIVERRGMPSIGTAVVGSDYGKPRWVTIEVE